MRINALDVKGALDKNQQLISAVTIVLKGNSRLILTIFCIVIDIGWINFTVIVYSDDE